MPSGLAAAARAGWSATSACSCRWPARASIVTWPDRRRLWPFFALLAAYAASVVMFFVFARYRFPLVPFLLLFAAAGCVAAPRLFAAAARRVNARTLAAVVAIVAVVANWPLLSSTLHARDHRDQSRRGASGRRRARRSGRALPARHRAAARLRARLQQPGHHAAGAGASRRSDRDLSSEALQLEATIPTLTTTWPMRCSSRAAPTKRRGTFDRRWPAVQSSADSAGTHNNLGIALAAQGQFDEAIADFGAASRAEPSSASRSAIWATPWPVAGRSDEALRRCERAIEVNPTTRRRTTTSAACCSRPASWSGRGAVFAQTLRINPQSAEAHNNLGIALASQGQLPRRSPSSSAHSRSSPTSRTRSGICRGGTRCRSRCGG